MSIQTEKNKLKSVLQATGIYDLNANGLLDAELSAYAAGLDILNESLKLLEKEAFVETADSFGIDLRESLFERNSSEVSADKRRKMLNYRTSVTANDFNRSGIERAIVTAGINADIVELKSIGQIYINCLSMLDPSIDKEKAQAAADSFLPAHLTAYFDFRAITWDNIESRNLSFDDMDSCDMTWNEIDVFTD